MNSMKQNPSFITFGWFCRACLVSLVLLSAALGELATPLGATERHWAGSASVNWSNPSNWDPVGPHENRDNLVFDHDSNTSMLNDVPDLTVGTSTFPGVGNPLLLTSVPSVRFRQISCL